LAGLEEVLPPDDEKLLDAAKAVLTGGKLTVNAAKVAERREAMVQKALAKEPVAVIILGGSHDLTDAVRGVIGERCEYIRVTVPAYLEYSGEAAKRQSAWRGTKVLSNPVKVTWTAAWQPAWRQAEALGMLRRHESCHDRR